jgi:uncharacterized membrane protein YgdD (TMEM256/DUF423 family)
MRLLSIASLFMALAVGCGAFGAHALRDQIPANDMAIWEKAVLYHLVHALAVIVLASAAEQFLSVRAVYRIGVLLLVSTTIFSGSLYLLVLTNQRWLGAITPLGGSGFIAAWIWLALVARKRMKS